MQRIGWHGDTAALWADLVIFCKEKDLIEHEDDDNVALQVAASPESYTLSPSELAAIYSFPSYNDQEAEISQQSLMSLLQNMHQNYQEAPGSKQLRCTSFVRRVLGKNVRSFKRQPTLRPGATAIGNGLHKPTVGTIEEDDEPRLDDDLLNPNLSSAEEFCEAVLEEAKESGAVQHEYLARLATGAFPNIQLAIADFAEQYAAYNGTFLKMAACVLGKLESAEHKAMLQCDLDEESGRMDEEKAAALASMGIPGIWYAGIPHSKLFQRFLAAAKAGVKNQTEGLNFLKELKKKATKSKENEPGKLFAEEMLDILRGADEAGAAGVLAFGVEGIVRWIYEPIVSAIKDHTKYIKAEDYCFFPLHIAVDDDHAETLAKIAHDLADSYDARFSIDAAVDAALQAREKLWDSLLARADAMPPPPSSAAAAKGNAPPPETSKLYDAAAGSWVRTEPTCLSDFTGRQPIFEHLQPILDNHYGQATVLDLGCGEGYVARKLREMGAASVLGIDISAEMINKARQEEEARPMGRLTYIVGDVAKQEVAKKASDVVGPEGFDLVACVFVFNYVSIQDMYATMKAAYSLLKPGGTFLFSVPHPAFQFWDRKKEPPFFFMPKDGGKGYFSGRDCPSEGFIYTTQGKALPVRCMHKCWSDYLESLNAAGFTDVPKVKELTVTEELAAKGNFFTPLQEVPLHVAFMAKKPVYANPASKPICWPVCTQAEDFYLEVPAAVHAELAGALAQARRQGIGHDAYIPGSLGDLPAVDKFGSSIAQALYQDLGAIVFKLDLQALGCCDADGKCTTVQQEASAKLAYAIVSHAVGMLRNDRGKLFDVKDRGLDIRNDNVLFSASSQACTFHTDSTNKDVFPDVVGLLCIRPASCSGGESLVSNAVNAYAKLQTRLPKFLMYELERSTTRDLIGTGFGGEDDILRELGRSEGVMLHRLRSNRFPVFGKKASAAGTEGLTFRYMRTWIESGHSRSGYRMSPLLKIAMDLLDQELDNACMVQCTLNPGDVLYCNNHITAHARTAFENGPTQASTAGTRLLVRSWIQYKHEEEN